MRLLVLELYALVHVGLLSRRCRETQVLANIIGAGERQ